MKIHIIQHESFESLGAIPCWIDRNQYTAKITRCYAGDNLPNSVEDFDFLIIMGGPQSPSTSLKECPHFDAKSEIALIKKAQTAQKLVLGICLGAQLIGEAFDAPYEHSPYREIGVFPIHLTPAAKEDSFFKNLPTQFEIAHWHGDMPGLTENAVILASSAACPRQIIRYNKNTYGFQCHFEFTLEAVKDMITECSTDLINANSLPYVQDAKTLLSYNYENMNQILFKFLDYFVSQHGN